MRGATARRRGEQRGAASVEAAILVSVLLVPLLSGVLYWGNYFWERQRVEVLEVTGIPQESVAGIYSCSELTNRVNQLLLANTTALATQLGVPAATIRRSSRVVRVLPTIGADVEVTIEVPVANKLASVLPLPKNGAIVTVATQRLENVKVSTSAC